MTPTDELPDDLLTVPPSSLTTAELEDMAVAYWGLTGSLTRLASERDLNHRLTTDHGSYVLKLSNPAEPPEMTDFQTKALQHVAIRSPSLCIPRVVPALDGRTVIPTLKGALRLVTWLDGTPMRTSAHSHGLRSAIGRALALLARSLQDFDHPAADHLLMWDIRHLPRLASLVPAIGDPQTRDTARLFIQRFATDIRPALDAVPWQIVHADFNPHNLLVSLQDDSALSGILDFGDMVRTPRICDVAVAASYQVDTADPLASIAALLRGYTAIVPLTAAELALLHDLVIARLYTTLLIANWRAARYPVNATYILRNVPSAEATLRALTAKDRHHAAEVFISAHDPETAR